MKYFSTTEKVLKIYNNLDKIKSAATKTTETIHQLKYDVYTVEGIITIKTSSVGYHIIEFDKEHYITHTYIDGGINSVPQLHGPSSDAWDIQTGEMLDEFLNNTIDKLKTIGEVFMF